MGLYRRLNCYNCGFGLKINWIRGLRIGSYIKKENHTVGKRVGVIVGTIDVAVGFAVEPGFCVGIGEEIGDGFKVGIDDGIGFDVGLDTGERVCRELGFMVVLVTGDIEGDAKVNGNITVSDNHIEH